MIFLFILSVWSYSSSLSDNLGTVSLPRTVARYRRLNIEELTRLAVNASKLQTIKQSCNERAGAAATTNQQPHTSAILSIPHLELNRETVARENAPIGIGKLGARNDISNLRNQIGAWTKGAWLKVVGYICDRLGSRRKVLDEDVPTHSVA